jgi:hypothetical protein
MTFEEIATGFRECKFGEVSKLRSLVRRAWDLLNSVLPQCEWSDLGISPSIVREPGSTWSSFVARAGFKTCLQGFQAGRRRMVVFYNRLSTMTMQAA